MSDPSLTPSQNLERRKSQKNRNMVLGLFLVGLVVLFYAVTLVKGVPLITARPM